MLLTIGLILGLLLGLTAAGTVLAVPLLLWSQGWTLPQATPIALIAIFASAAVGTVAAWDVRVIRYRLATLMAAAGILAAPAGLYAARTLPLWLLNALFALAMIASAARMWQQSRHADNGEQAAPSRWCRLDPVTGRIVWNGVSAAVITGVGAAGGFFAGLLGISGGVVMIPALRSFTELSMHSAVATTLMAIALTSGGIVLINLAHGDALPWAQALPFAAGALAGVIAARRLAPRIAGRRLQQAFAALTLIGALGMAVHALESL